MIQSATWYYKSSSVAPWYPHNFSWATRSTRNCSSFPNDSYLQSLKCLSQSDTVSARFSIFILSCSVGFLICRSWLISGPVWAGWCSLSWVALKCVLMRISSLFECIFLGGRLNHHFHSLPLARYPSSSATSCLAVLFWAALHSARRYPLRSPVNWPWPNSFSIIALRLVCWKGLPATSVL